MTEYDSHMRNLAPATYADGYHNGGRVVTVIQLCAPHDPNGNPRRVFVGFTDQGHVAAIADTGYGNGPAWYTECRARGLSATSYATTAAEYNHQLRRIENNRGAFGLFGTTDGRVDVYPFARFYTRARANHARRTYYLWMTDATVAPLVADAHGNYVHADHAAVTA